RSVKKLHGAERALRAAPPGSRLPLPGTGRDRAGRTPPHAEANPVVEPARMIPSFAPDPALYPFRHRWLDGSLARVHYVDEGEGEPILFVHGNPTWSFLWRGLVTRLRPRFRCLALDLPGFGLSPQPPGFEHSPREHAAVVGELIRE